MDHAYISENAIAEQYVRRSLPDEEAARFEEHFLVCADCRMEVELAGRFRDGLRGNVTPLRRPFPFVAAAIAVAASVAIAWLAVDASRIRRELNQSRQEVATLQSRAPRDRAATIDIPRALSGIKVLSLGLARDASPQPPVLLKKDGAPAVILTLEVADAAEYPEYRATLTQPGQPARSIDGLKPSGPDSVALVAPSDWLASGDVQILLQAKTKTGSLARIGTFRLRVN